MVNNGVESVGHVYNEPGTFTVISTFENSGGCFQTIYYDIYIYMYEEIVVPNSFNPTSSNVINRTFRPFVVGGSEDYTMIIYDRWGSPLFQTFQIERGWDGKNSKGDLVPGDVYIYLIEFTNTLGKTQRKKGIVLILN